MLASTGDRYFDLSRSRIVSNLCAGCYNCIMKQFPPLDFSHRSREFNCYNDKQKAAVIYNWLVTGMSTREMDEKILSLDSSSKGYQSFGIYRYLGLNGKHQGFFKGWPLPDIIELFHQLCRNPDYCIIFYYFLDCIDRHDLSDADNTLIAEANEYQPEDSLKEQTWIRNSWIGNSKDVNDRLLELPDIPEGKRGQVRISHSGTRYEYYSSTTVKETIKDLYDFRCQICGDVILRTGWKSDMNRVDSWRYLSADVHHILPLSEGGPDVKSNMLCLCPTCHRKFHSGEFRIKPHDNAFIVRDELIGQDRELINRHRIIIW